MPALAPIVLKDRASTPVNHTFNPKGINANGVAEFVEYSGVPLGDKRLTVGSTDTASGRIKTEARLAVPIVVTETINGVSVPKIIDTQYFTLTSNVGNISTEQQRKDLIGMGHDLTDALNTFMNLILTKNERPF